MRQFIPLDKPRGFLDASKINLDVKINKGVCERYSVRVVGKSAWGIIMLCEDSGAVSIISDYGEWGYIWSHHGRESLKHFLIEIDKHYAWGKFSGKRVFSHDKTISSLSECLEDMDQPAAKSLQDLHYCHDSDDFCRLLENNVSALFDFVPDFHEYINTDIDCQFSQFFDEIWVPFVEELLKEHEAWSGSRLFDKFLGVL